MPKLLNEKRVYQRLLHSEEEQAQLKSKGFEAVFSSNVSAIARDNSNLLIRFHGGATYSYRNKGKDFDRIMGAASKGKWVWRFLIRPSVPYSRASSVIIKNDVPSRDMMEERPKPKFKVEAIVPSEVDRMKGALPQIRIVPLNQATKILIGGNENAIKKALMPTIIDRAVKKEVVKDFVPAKVFNENDYIKPTPEMRKEFGVRLETISKEEKRAIKMYTVASSQRANGYLRGEKEYQRDINNDNFKLLEERIKLIKNVTSNKIGKDIKIYRNMQNIDKTFINDKILDNLPSDIQNDFIKYLNSQNNASTFGEAKAELFEGLLGTMKGTTFKDKGFISTTLDESLGNDGLFGDVRLNIFAPKETKGAFIETISLNKDEEEVLLDSNTEFEIINIRKSSKKFNLILDVRVVNNE